MPGCCAFGCSNRTEGGYSMKHFPTDPVRRKLWFIKVRRLNWVPTKGSYLCEAHFEDDQWQINKAGKRRLKRDAVPTIFHHSPLICKRKPPNDQNVQQSEKLVKPPIVLSVQSNEKLGKPPIVQTVQQDENLGKPPIDQSIQQNENLREPPVDISVQQNENLRKPPIGLSVQPNEKLGMPPIDQSIQQKENLGKPPIVQIVQQNEILGMSPIDQSIQQKENLGKLPNDQSVQETEKIGNPVIDQSILQNGKSEVTNVYGNQKIQSIDPFIKEMIKMKQGLMSAHETITKLRKENIALRLKLRVRSVQLCRLKKSKVRKYGDIFNEDQLEALQRKNMAFKNWSDKTIETALDLKLSCGKKGYNKLLQLKLPYPSLRTLQRRLNSSKSHEESSTLSDMVHFSSNTEISVLDSKISNS